MDLDTPHFRTTSTGRCSATNAATTTSDLFICFTSRLSSSSSSSSSMKLTRSILSPIRATRNGGPISLSFLSRRLRTNGSLKGGQASPFFTTTGKKRGGAFENPEPSSPKVTCIGQVRVKSKKKVKQCRSISQRRIGEVSFRQIEQSHADHGGQQSEDKVCTRPQRYSNASAHYQQQQQPQECLPHRNQRWVHLPISVCEALRAFGAEFSCLFPCKSSCFSTSEREKAEKSGCYANENGCGAVFARWLVSVNAGEGGKSREIELVVGGGDEERAERMSIRSSRRHVFEDIEVKDDIIEANGRSLEGEEEAARASICIPPKNALLLMRCRSDPIKMAALANGGCWDAHAAPKYENEDIEKENHGEESADFGEQEEVRGFCEGKEKIFVVKEAEVDEVFEQDVAVSVKPNEEQEIQNEAEANLEMEVGDHGCVEELYEEELVISSEEKQQAIKANEEALVEEEKEDVESNMSSFEALLDQENTEHYEDCPIQVKEEVEESPTCHISSSAQSDEEAIDRNAVTSVPEEAAIEKEKEEETEESTTSEKDTTFANNDTQNQVTAQLKPKPGRTHQEDEKEEQKAIQPTKSEAGNPENQELVISNQETKKEKESPALPECLLLMMCEPKLSMEVSKETWVRSTDFIRRLPERPRKPAKTTIISGCDHNPVKRRPSIDSKPKPRVPAPPTKRNDLQPPRSSCSLPAASMATIIEQKLGNAGGYEPFALTRCKSEPMSTAAAKLMPESCSWKNASMKLEPHRRTTLGVGAAGVGF